MDRNHGGLPFWSLVQAQHGLPLHRAVSEYSLTALMFHSFLMKSKMNPIQLNTNSYFIKEEKPDDVFFMGEYILVSLFEKFKEWLQENKNEEIKTPKTRSEYEKEELERKYPKKLIREIFLNNGFTIKEDQTDLKDYVYDAAYALLKQFQPPSLPRLTTVVNLTPAALKRVAAHIQDDKNIFCQLITSDNRALYLPATIAPVFDCDEQYVITFQLSNSHRNGRIVFIEDN